LQEHVTGQSQKVTKFQGHRSKVKATWPEFLILYHRDIRPCW